MNEYLTERSLFVLLNELYPNQKFIHNRIVPNSGTQKRPDYRSEQLRLIVEFDGQLHYTKAKKIIDENFKNDTYENMGYKVVRIPYFIQPSKEIINLLFGIDGEYEQSYPQGFIANNVHLPADYCELGIIKFRQNLEKFDVVKKEIIQSLHNKINIKGIELVLPPSLYDLID